MKRFSVILIAFVLLLSLFSPGISKAAEGDDITGHYFENDMRVLIHKEILSGYGEGIYRPDKEVTRAEFTAFLVRALDIETLSTAEFSIAEVSESPVFHDVEPDDWYYSAVIAATKQELVGGYPSGYFRPNKKISRQEMALMMKRAVDSKGVISEEAPLDFTDKDEIKSMFRPAIQSLLYLGIMSGKKNADGRYFAPLDNTTRGETSAIIHRMLNVIDPPDNYEYTVVSLTEGQDPVILGHYPTLDDAKNRTRDNQVVMKGNNIVWISEGIAVSNKFAYFYPSSDMENASTYVTSGVEMKYYEATDEWVKVQLADRTGYVAADTINLNPQHLITNRSYYEAKNGDLIHRLYNPIRESYASYTYGKAPSFMTEGQKYYSWNGDKFYNSSGNEAGDAYQYFNRMPLYTETQYTAEQLDEYLRAVRPDSPLVGTGSAFKKAEKEHGTNALYFLAHAIHESNWGESRIARDKNNLFGIGAIDSNPYENARSYDSYEAGILEAAKDFIVPGYFRDADWRFEGAHLGNKSTGMNVRYASDVYWGQKISGLMYRIDKHLSNEYDLASENARNNLAVSVATNLNVRSEAKVSNTNYIYSIPQRGTTVEILEVVPASGTWYKIEPKNILGNDFAEAYAYSHGYDPYGTSLKLLPLAK